MKKKLPEIRESLSELKELLKAEEDSRKQQHLQALYLLKSQPAETRKQVTQRPGVHRDTVGRWLAS